MKTLFFSFILVLSLSVQGQRGHGNSNRHGHHPGRHAYHSRVVVRSSYRPAAMVVYHPYWRPAYTCHRRWVYFPARNMYWDNWRNHYVFWNGTVWISQSAPPAGISEKQLEKDTARELKGD